MKKEIICPAGKQVEIHGNGMWAILNRNMWHWSEERQWQDGTATIAAVFFVEDKENIKEIICLDCAVGGCVAELKGEGKKLFTAFLGNP